MAACARLIGRIANPEWPISFACTTDRLRRSLAPRPKRSGVRWLTISRETWRLSGRSRGARPARRFNAQYGPRSLRSCRARPLATVGWLPGCNVRSPYAPSARPTGQSDQRGGALSSGYRCRWLADWLRRRSDAQAMVAQSRGCSVPRHAGCSGFACVRSYLRRPATSGLMVDSKFPILTPSPRRPPPARHHSRTRLRPRSGTTPHWRFLPAGQRAASD